MSRLIRKSNGAVLAEKIFVCETERDRTVGLLNHDRLADGEGMYFPRTRLIHTIGMKFAIDLVYLDEEMTVVKIVERMAPWRLSACLSADSVLELSSGAAKTLGISRGDKLDITSGEAS